MDGHSFSPVWQAPTGSIAGPELCAGVCEAGGVGSMGLTWTEPDMVREFVSNVRMATDRLFHVNFVLHFPPRGLKAALEAGAPAISFSWGDPATHVSLIRSFGAALGVQVVNREAVRRAVALGADFLVCQGVEAGGHVQSSTPLAELLPQVLDASQGVPVVAAGGLADGADLARVLDAGAAAGMFGTRFVASHESRAHPAYKRLLVESGDAALTTCFDGGWPGALHRVLRNSTFSRWEAAGCPTTDRPGEDDAVARWTDGEEVLRYSDAAPQERMEGDIEAMCLYAGAGCVRIRSIAPAADIVAVLRAEAGR